MDVDEDLVPKILRYDLEKEDYSPLIVGDVNELLVRIERYGDRFPRMVKLFGNILRNGVQRHPLLEDWLIIIHYQFFWDDNCQALQWLEDRQDELAEFIGEDAWEAYREEAIMRANCTTAGDLLDRLYDIQLEAYGALYLGKLGRKPEFIPRSNDEKKPDVKGTGGVVGCVLECKFIHTSEKYEAFFRRLDRAAYSYGVSRPSFVLVEQCRFPSSVKLKAFSPAHCLAVKKFLRKIYQDRSVAHIATFRGETFTYRASLPANLVTIDNQRKFAEEQADAFASRYLKRLLDEAAPQLKKVEYDAYEKILFIGLQPDALYMSPWNEGAISHAKSAFIPLAEKQGITPVFSEDVGFNVRGYL